MNLIDIIKHGHRRIRAAFSRRGWALRLLDLPRCTGIDDDPGLIMIQIDGLAWTQFRRALDRGRLPFLKRLTDDRGFVAKPFYSGMPSSTPAVQGELYYGVKTAVPAFEFVDRQTRLRHAMFQPTSADAVARRLLQSGRPLLAGGSSYSNIYSGGAARARYCAETMNLESLIRTVNPFRLMLWLVSQTVKLFKIALYASLELMLSVYDCIRGLSLGKNIAKELKFIPTRVFGCAMLRELIRLRVKLDVHRGVAIVAANFIGYDEQAHRRGPASAFAHWTLKGIDRVVEDLYHCAMGSRCRDYEVIIFSDHGQESVEAYEHRYPERSVKQAIREVFQEITPDRRAGHAHQGKNTTATIYRRAGSYFFGQGKADRLYHAFGTGHTDQVRITTMGPLGHVYLPDRIRRQLDSTDPFPTREEVARRLTRQVNIPLVLFKGSAGIVAVTRSGIYTLSRDAKIIFGADHPFVDPVAEDLHRLCLHPNAGDFVISGWDPTDEPLSFSVESGAHGGPGKEETRGFVMLPPAIGTDAAWLRPLDLRNEILAYREKHAQRLQTQGKDGSGMSQMKMPPGGRDVACRVAAEEGQDPCR